MASVADKSQESAGSLGEGEGRKPAHVERKAPPAPRNDAPGFFTIYRRGRGKWTRLGTAGAVGLVIALVCRFLYSDLLTFAGVGAMWRAIAVGMVFLGMLFWGFRLMNRPTNVEFLIATDDEMKKVNWTTRKELIGSTRVVIFFMFAIALFLLVTDIAFAFLFWLVGVLDKSLLPFDLGK